MRFLLVLCCLATIVSTAMCRAEETASPKYVSNLQPFRLDSDDKEQNFFGSLELSPDGTRVALCGADWGDGKLPENQRQKKGLLQIWDVRSRRKLLDCIGHADLVRTVRWSSDGQWLASQSQDGAIMVWNAINGKRLQVLWAARPQRLEAEPDDENKTHAQEWQDVKDVYDEPKLLGFSNRNQQVLALSAQVTLAKPPKDGRAVSAYNITSVLRTWNVQDGRLARNVAFGKANSFHYTAAIGHDGKTFVLGRYDVVQGESRDRRIETRDLQSGQLLDTLRFDKEYDFPVALSRDGRYAVLVPYQDNEFLSESQTAQVWDVATKQRLQVLAGGEANFVSAQFSPDHRKLLIAGRAGAIEVFDVQSGQLERRLGGGHQAGINAMQITPDGNTLLSVGQGDNLVQQWDLTLPDSVAPMPRAIAPLPSIHKLHFAPDGSFWAVDNRRDVLERRAPEGLYIDGESGLSVDLRRYDIAGKELQNITLPERSLVDNLIFSPGFKRVAGSLSTRKLDIRRGDGIGVWDLATETLMWRLPAGERTLDVLAWSPDGKTLSAASSGGGPVQLWSMETGKLLRVLVEPQSAVHALSFTRDGNTLAIGTLGGSILLFDMASNEVRDQISEDSSVSLLEFSPDGKYLLSGGDIHLKNQTVGFKVRIWDMAKTQIEHEWEYPKCVFGGATWSPDGQNIAISHSENTDLSEDAKIELWSVAPKQLLAVLSDVSGAFLPTFAPDGRTLLSLATEPNGAWIKRWNIEALKP